MREAKRSPELWEDGKRYAFPAFPQLLLLNKVENINPDTSGKHQPGRSHGASNVLTLNCGPPNGGLRRAARRLRRIQIMPVQVARRRANSRCGSRLGRR